MQDLKVGDNHGRREQMRTESVSTWYTLSLSVPFPHTAGSACRKINDALICKSHRELRPQDGLTCASIFLSITGTSASSTNLRQLRKGGWDEKEEAVP